MTDKPPRTTTDAGNPVASDEFSLTVGPDGPILLQDQDRHAPCPARRSAPDHACPEPHSGFWKLVQKSNHSRFG